MTKNILLLSGILFYISNIFCQSKSDYIGSWNLTPDYYPDTINYDQVWKLLPDGTMFTYLRGRDDIPEDSLLLKYSGKWDYDSSSKKLSIIRESYHYDGTVKSSSKPKTLYFYVVIKDDKPMLRIRDENGNFDFWFMSKR